MSSSFAAAYLSPATPSTDLYFLPAGCIDNILGVPDSPEIYTVEKVDFEKAKKELKLPEISTEAPNIPTLTITPTISADKDSQSISFEPKQGEFNYLQVPLEESREKLLKEIKTEEQKAIEKAHAAELVARKAEVKLARKTFLTKLGKSCFAIAGLALAIGLAVPTGGIAIAPAVILGVTAVFSVADTVSAAVDWGLKAHGKDGLPMESDATANIAYALFKAFKATDEDAGKYAGWTASGVKIVLTVGLLWADTVSPKILSTVKPTTITDTGSRVLELAGEKLTKYADAINITKEKLEALENDERRAEVYSEVLKQERDELEDIDEFLTDKEQDVEQKLKAKRQAIRSKQTELMQQLKESRAQLQQLRDAIKQVAENSGKNSIKKLQELLELGSSAHVLLEGVTERSADKYKAQVFSAAQVPLPSEFDFSKHAKAELRVARRAAIDAETALKEAELSRKSNIVKVKVFRCLISALAVGGACAATAFYGPITAPAIFFSVGTAITSFFDAGAAIVELQRYRKGQAPLPIKDNGIANAINFLLVFGFKINAERSIKLSKVLAGVISVAFTLGGKLPQSEDGFYQRLQDSAEMAEPIEEAIGDHLLDDGWYQEAKMEKDIQEMKVDLAREQLHRVRLACESHYEYVARRRLANRLLLEKMNTERKLLRMQKAEVTDLINRLERSIANLSSEELRDNILSNLSKELSEQIKDLVERIQAASSANEGTCSALAGALHSTVPSAPTLSTGVTYA